MTGAPGGHSAPDPDDVLVDQVLALQPMLDGAVRTARSQRQDLASLNIGRSDHGDGTLGAMSVTGVANRCGPEELLRPGRQGRARLVRRTRHQDDNAFTLGRYAAGRRRPNYMRLA